MIEALDLFEVHLTVRNLDEAIGFYRDIVGLTVAHVTTGRQAAFFWIGAARKAMLGLWLAGSAPQWVTLHTAFRVSWTDVMAAPDLLRHAGVTPLDFDGRPTDLPVVLAWMPAAAVYFRDPDGHLLEYIAMLPHEPRPDCGVVPWRTWELMQSSPVGADDEFRSEHCLMASLPANEHWAATAGRRAYREGWRSSWNVPERPQQQCDLSPMMNAMNGRMVQQLSQLHGLPGAATDCKLHYTPEILVSESRQEFADARFDVAPQVFDLPFRKNGRYVPPAGVASPDAATIVWITPILSPAADGIEATGWAMIVDKTMSG